jgi:hypothetical protein
LERDLRYLTMLRDPVSRTISWYSHVRRDPNAYRHSRVVDENWSLLDFVRDTETNWDTTNAQTLFVAVDLDYSRLARDPVGYGQAVVKQYARRLDDPVLLDTAKRRLAEFAFVGITERMQDSINLLCYQMDWYPDTSAPKLNVAPVRPRNEECSDETRQAISAITRLDQELYDWSWQRFEERFDQMVKLLIVPNYKSRNIERKSRRCQIVATAERKHFNVDTVEAPSRSGVNAVFHCVVEIANQSSLAITSAPPHPVNVSYHWIDKGTGSVVVFDGERTPIAPALATEETRRFVIVAKAPSVAGVYTLRTTLVQEGVAWFDEDGSGVFCDATIAVE